MQEIFSLMWLLLIRELYACSWTKRAAPRQRWMSAASTALGDDTQQIAWVGGTKLNYINGKPMGDRANVSVYDLSSNSWYEDWPSMPTARSAPATGVLHSRLYVFGGSMQVNSTTHQGLSTITLDVVESFPFSAKPSHQTNQTKSVTSSWSSETRLPQRIESPSAVSLEHGIVIAGGFSSYIDNETHMLHFAYHNETWLFDGKGYHTLPKLPFSRSNMGLVAAHGGIYALGGGELDPSYNNCSFLANVTGKVIVSKHGKLQAESAAKWETCPDLLEARSWMATGVATNQTSGEDIVVVAGGMSDTFSPMSGVDFLLKHPSSIHVEQSNPSSVFSDHVEAYNRNRTEVQWQPSNCDLPFKSGFLSGDGLVTSNNSFTFILYSGEAPFPEADGAYVLTIT